LNAAAESKPVVGSSRNITLGKVRTCDAIAHLRFSPPLIPLTNTDPILLSATLSNPNSRIIS
jgi:hypothetical protein